MPLPDEKPAADSQKDIGNLKEYGTIRRSTLKDIEAGFRQVLYSYRSSARRRNLEWRLTPEETLVLLAQRCFYCGVAPERTIGRRKKNASVTEDDLFQCGGIDRIDNTLGYTPENCCPSCERCNRAKGTMSRAEFYEWITRAFTNLQSGKIIAQT